MFNFHEHIEDVPRLFPFVEPLIVYEEVMTRCYVFQDPDGYKYRIQRDFLRGFSGFESTVKLLQTECELINRQLILKQIFQGKRGPIVWA